MKKNFMFLLMAALVRSLSLSVTSCSKDDDGAMALLQRYSR